MKRYLDLNNYHKIYIFSDLLIKYCLTLTNDILYENLHIFKII